MEASEVSSSTKMVVSTLRDSIAAGKEAGKLVEDVQADSHAVIVQQQRMRERERHRQENLGSHQEQKAYQRYTAKLSEAQVTAELKAHVLKSHGESGWGAYLATRAEVEAEEKLELEKVSDDEHRMIEATWWCFAVGALLAYLLVVGGR